MKEKYRINGRTAKQCRERWKHNVDPEINTAPLSDKEIEKFIKLQQIYGNSWTKIAKKFKGRSDNALKNLFHGMKRKQNRNSSKVKFEDILDKDSCKNEVEDTTSKIVIPLAVRGNIENETDIVLNLTPKTENETETTINFFNQNLYQDLKYQNFDMSSLYNYQWIFPFTSYSLNNQFH